MNKPLLGAFALAAIALAACNPPPPPPCPTCPPPAPPAPKADVQAESDAIKALDAKWVEAIATKDTDAVVAFYADDATFLPPNKDSLTGDALKAEWAGMWGMTNVSLTFAPTRIEVDKDGEMAIDVGTYQFSFDGPKGKVEDHGKYTQVWEKKDGTWKCAVDMYNSSVPMPEAAAAPAAKKK
jgi:uncharacterized protein (TIGR02246 family)